jgi:ATP-binding cassette, subfamily B, bacterial PglK
MMKQFINKIRFILSRKDEYYLFLLLLFAIAISMIETIGITAIMPFIAVASDFSLIETNQYYRMFFLFLGFENKIDFIGMFGVLLIFFFLFRSVANISFEYFKYSFSESKYRTLTERLFRTYLGMPYKKYTKVNSSVLTKTIITDAASFTLLLNHSLLFVSELFVFIFIYLVFLIVNFQLALLITSFIGFTGLLMVRLFSRVIKKKGALRTEMAKEFFEIIGKSFANYKMVKLNANMNVAVNRFEKSCYRFSQANTISATLQGVPRLVFETLGFGVVVIMIIYLVSKSQSSFDSAIPTITIFVLGLYRLLPSTNRLLSSYNIILYNYKSLQIIHRDLNYENESLGDTEVQFESTIRLQDVSFEYDLKKRVLNNVNLKIKKGEKIAFVGESGAGKSTIVDLIMGLYSPQEGGIFVDDVCIDNSNIKNWRKKMGYIPQSIYLFDGTVGENIAFDRKFDKEKVIEVLKKANIFEFLQGKNGINTKVGEGGIMFSGGQIQRIAIARALYGDPEILVLDEATSALDSELEIKIMDEIYKESEGKTLIIIAHRPSTYERCENIYKIINGEIFKI